MATTDGHRAGLCSLFSPLAVCDDDDINDDDDKGDDN